LVSSLEERSHLLREELDDLKEERAEEAGAEWANERHRLEEKYLSQLEQIKESHRVEKSNL